MSQVENTLVLLRASLQQRNIKLWEEPYYVDNVGSNDAALEQLSQELSRDLHLSAPSCKSGLLELQQNALRKLVARRQFSETGMATFHIRCVDNRGGTTNRLQVQCNLSELGEHLLRQITEQLQLSDTGNLKCIAAGRMVAPQQTLQAQGLKNNQQLLIIVGTGDVHNVALYERIQQIQRDVEVVIGADHRFVELEDQDGNTIILPPNENRALLLGMGLCEKARAAMRRERYDEALLLFLEADNNFANCNSKFLEAVDNYALLNLDIVWCYLCLKNISQLPDAQRRLDICERIFRRSYGVDNSRLYALKGQNCPERALLMRLKLLQGVVLFHQNQREDALVRLQAAGTALAELKVNTEYLALLVEMGFDAPDARLALRSCNGNMDQAVQFIQQRRQRLEEARLNSESERETHGRLTQLQVGNDDRDWVNPRSVCRLIELGYDRQLVMEALRRTENDIARSLELLQSHADELRRNLPATTAADEQMLATLNELGFELPAARAALETTRNDLNRSIEFLLKSFVSEEELINVVEHISSLTAQTDEAGVPSSSRLIGATASKLALVQSVLDKAKTAIESYSAYKRFNEELSENDQDYLDLPLEQEEQILNEYLQLLQH